MATLTANRFLDLVQRSNLVDKDQLKQALDQYTRHAGGQLPDSCQPLAEFLVKSGHLSPWQVGKLKEGRYKGFFLGQYKLLGHLSRGGMSSIYLAEHVHMGRRRPSRCCPRAAWRPRRSWIVSTWRPRPQRRWITRTSCGPTISTMTVPRITL